MAKGFKGLDDEWLEKASKHYLEIAYEGVLQGLAGNHTLKETLERRMIEVDEKERLNDEKWRLKRAAENVFLEVFKNFCAAYFIEAELDISFGWGHRFAFKSYMWDSNDFELFDALVGVTRFDYTGHYSGDAYVPFKVNLWGGFFNKLLGIETIVLTGNFETDNNTSRSDKVSNIDMGLEDETSDQITKDHITILRYIADQTAVFEYGKEKDDIDQYRRMRKVIIEDGLKEIVEGTLTKEDFEQKLFLAKLAGF
jgi:hypothetical protein